MAASVGNCRLCRGARRGIGGGRSDHGVRTGSADVRQPEKLCGMGRPRAEVALDEREVSSRIQEQNGQSDIRKILLIGAIIEYNGACTKAFSLQLAGPHDSSQTKDGGRHRTGK